MNSGQLCGSWTRLLVPRAKLKQAAEQVAALANTYTVGDPLDPVTQMGPLVSSETAQDRH